MDWRWLMNRAGDRFEILGVERKRINVSIPADDIEGMMRHRHAGPTGSIFDQNLDVPFLVDWVKLGRSVKVAFGIRRAHFYLTFAVQIAFRNADRPGRFENKIVFFFNLIRHQPVCDSPGNDDVILRAITLFAENRLERAATFEDENDFVGTAILIIFEFSVQLLRPRPPRRHILVEQNRDAPAVEIAATRNIRGLYMLIKQLTDRCLLQLFTFQE